MPRGDAVTDVCALAELDDKRIVERTIDGRRVAIARWGDAVYAFNAKCPHRGAPMARGKLFSRLEADGPGELRVADSAPVVSCPWHGWEFELDGGENIADQQSRCLLMQRCEVVDGRILLHRRARAAEPTQAERHTVPQAPSTTGERDER